MTRATFPAILATLGLAGFAHAQGQITSWGNGGGDPPQPLVLPMLKIGSGAFHGMAVLADGTVRCWGENLTGQCNAPATLGPVAKVAGGSGHSLAVKLNGELVCWGANDSGQATVPAGLGAVQAIAGGGLHSVALRDNGTVVCWGDNSAGQSAVPATLGSARAIAAGLGHTLALRTDNTVRAWGSNTNLFDEVTGQATVPAALGTASAIAAGWYHSVAVKTNGSVACWGDNSFGQSAVPAGVGAVSQIGAGFGHTLALRPDGTVVSWGLEEFLTPPPGLGGIVAIAVGAGHSLGLRADGSVECWGVAFGVCDAQRSIGSVTRVDVGGLHGIALRQNGTVTCWGSGDDKQTSVPASVATATAVAAGEDHSVAVLPTGRVVAWGSNAVGQCLGTDAFGLPLDQPIEPTSAEWGTPVRIDGVELTLVAQVASAMEHNVARRTNGSVVCWGSNWTGEIEVPFGLPAAIDVAAGGGEVGSHSLAAVQGGFVAAWGSDFDDGFEFSGQSSPPATLSGVTKVAAGAYHSVALRSNGTVVCWGSNSGPKGATFTGQCVVPAGLAGVTAIAAGSFHTVALRSNGTVACWGSNQLGETATPANLAGVTAIAAGNGITLAVLDAARSSCANAGGAGIATVAVNASLWQDIGTWSWSGAGSPQVPGSLTDVKLGAFGSVASQCAARAKTFEARAGSTLLVTADFSAPLPDQEIDIGETATLAGRIWLLASGASTLPANLNLPVLSTPAPVGSFDILQSTLPAPPGKFLTLVPTSSLGGTVSFSLRLLDLPGAASLSGGDTASFAGIAVAAESMDVNGDGLDDLALAIDFGPTQQGRLQVLLNDGNGSLGGTSILRSVPARPLSLATGDANGDGRDDAVIGIDSDNTARLFLGGGSGNGTLTASTVFNVPGNPVSLAVIPGDAASLLGGAGTVVAGSSGTTSGGQASFYPPGSSTPTQQKPLNASPRAIGRRGRTIATGGSTTTTVDGLLAGATDGLVEVLSPDAGGQYAVVQQIAVPGTPKLLDFADIDGDGFDEIVTANAAPTPLGAGSALPVLTLFRGSSTVFGQAVPIAPQSSLSARDVTLLDVNADGVRDIVSVVDKPGGTTAATLIPVKVGVPGGPLTLLDEVPIPAEAPILSVSGDFDGGGGDDLFVVDASGTFASGAGGSFLGVEGVARVFQGSTDACNEDIVVNGQVDGTDLTTLLVAWATATTGPADLNGDGVVNAADLSALLLAWGPCPGALPD